MSGNKILIVAAHPDDEILGCAGTVARMVKEGSTADTFLIGLGRVRPQEELKQFMKNSLRANEIIGVDNVSWITPALPDNEFDSVTLMNVVKVIEDKIKFLQPDIIFTHFKDDLNVDHRITYQAVITATRPIQSQCVKEIYSFEIPSSTEWAFPTSFSPDMFVDIFQTINAKLMALEQYRDELREFPHPRSLAGVEILAHYRGMQVGLDKAEAFKTVRVIR